MYVIRRGWAPDGGVILIRLELALFRGRSLESLLFLSIRVSNIEGGTFVSDRLPGEILDDLITFLRRFETVRDVSSQPGR